MSIKAVVKKFVFLFSLALLTSQCGIGELEFDNLEVQPISGVFVFPLGNVSYSIQDLLDEQLDDQVDLQTGDADVLGLTYFDTVSYQSDTDFIQIDQITQSGNIDVPAVPSTGAQQQQTITVSFSDFEYQPVGDEQINELIYATGDLAFDVTAVFASPTVQLAYTVTVVNTEDPAGTPVSFTGTITGSGTNTDNQSLVDHRTFLSSSATTQNTFEVTFDGTFTIPAGSSLVATDQISFNLNFANQTFSSVSGLFGRDTVSVAVQPLDLSFFEDFGDGFFFGNPKISFDFRNEFGIPFGLDFSGLTAENERNAETVNLSGSITRDLPVVNAAPSLGATEQTLLEINKSNSNIVELLSISPNELSLGFDVISNPTDLTVENFIQPGNEIEGYATIEVPLEIRLEDLEQDVFFGLGSGVDTVQIDSAFFRVVSVNTLPFSATVKIEIQDADSVTIFTVEESPVLKAPFIDVVGFVQDPGGTSIDIPLSEEGVGALANGSHVRLVIILNTPESVNSRDIFVKVLAEYALEVKVGLGVKLNREI